jgi:Ca2+-binding EF-hand superfamily protein
VDELPRKLPLRPLLATLEIIDQAVSVALPQNRLSRGNGGMRGARFAVTIDERHGSNALRSFVLALVGLSAALCHGRAHAESPRRVAKSSPTPEVGRSGVHPKPDVDTLLRAADSNGDGQVTGRELEAFVLPHVEKQVQSRFQRLDRNHDGVIVPAEVPTMDRARFARFDLNGDQELVSSELGQVIRSQVLARCRAVFARMDRDRDGAITASERSEGKPLRLSKRD